MPYGFSFDLTNIPKKFFTEIARMADEKKMHKRLGKTVRSLVKKFGLDETTGLDISNAILLIEDFIDIQVKNMINRDRFLKTRKRALLLPHCSRKYMDNRCKAIFNSELPSYECQHCSRDCLIHQATILGKQKGYDIFVLPGGSCITKILQTRKYEAVVGVACGEEIKLGMKVVKKFGLPGQAVPLIKNGCANTKFDINLLRSVLS
jgi:hypothetical protein